MMRLYKILTALTAVAVISTDALAQDYGFFGLYGDRGALNSNFTINADDIPSLPNGEEVRDLRIRMQVGPDIPNSPANGGGTFSVRIDLQYLDIEFLHINTGVPARLSELMAVSDNTNTVVNLGTHVYPGTTETGAPILGAFAVGGRWIEVGRVVAFRAAFIGGTNQTHLDPFLRTGTQEQGRPLPKMIIKWGNIRSRFGVNNPTTDLIANIGSSINGSIGGVYAVPVLGNTFTVVPEPASVMVLGTGLATLLAMYRRRK